MARDFLTTNDWTKAELLQLLDDAEQFKRHENSSKPLTGRSVALVFFNPSLRTRASMQVGVYELGGNPVILEPGGSSWTLEHSEGSVMDGDKTEHVAEFVRVLSRYCSAIGVRSFAELANWDEERTDPVLRAFSKYSEVPVINLESAMHHPCQALADMMTIREKLGPDKKRVVLTWAWHPKALPMAVPNSFALATAQMGHHLTVACPKGYDLDEVLMTDIDRHATETGGSVNITRSMDDAFARADVIYAKSWGSKSFYGNSEAETLNRAHYRYKWIVNRQRMQQTNEAIFMHCLPVRRNVIVTDEVIDSRRSAVIDEAENRLHVQKAILKRLLE